MKSLASVSSWWRQHLEDLIKWIISTSAGGSVKTTHKEPLCFWKVILEQHSNYWTWFPDSVFSVEGRVVYSLRLPNPFLTQWFQYYFASYWIKGVHFVLPVIWCEAVPRFSPSEWQQRKLFPCSGHLHQRTCLARSFWQFERTQPKRSALK